MNLNLDSAKDTACKNILIYGYCKYENKGCAFSHLKIGKGLPQVVTNEDTTQANNNNNSDSKKKFNFNTPSFKPSANNKFSPNLDGIASFTPNNFSTSDSNVKSESINGSKKFNTSATAFTPGGLDNTATNDSYGFALSNNYSTINSVQSSLPISLNLAPPSSSGSMSIQSKNSDIYFHNSQSTNYPLNYHLYAPAPPPRLSIPLPPYETNANTMFIPNDLRESLTKKNEATLSYMRSSNLPDNVNVYHSLVPLDIETQSRVWNTTTAIYKVFSNTDGNPYVLRKLNTEGLTVIDSDSFKTIKRWKKIKCSNIAKLQDCFTSISFDGLNSKLVMIYDYYPNSITLVEHHINRKVGNKLEPITEQLLWGYIVQITNALIKIHEHGLAARSSLDLTKIIVTNKNRIKLSSVGVSDILNHPVDKTSSIKEVMHKEQIQDFKRFGLLILDLAVLMVPNGKNHTVEEKISSIKHHVSKELVDIITKLINDYEYVNLQKLNEFYVSRRSLDMVNDLQDANDYIEGQLGGELENARLFRLIAKINFIVEHPLLNWQENDKIYVIKLFNDFIFHQLDGNNKPVLDLSRVLTKLNKLDVGTDERFMLISNDQKLSILVSYKEVRDIIDGAFRRLTQLQ